MKRIKKGGQIFNIIEVFCKKDGNSFANKDLGWFPIEKAPTPYVWAVKFDNGKTTRDPDIVRKAYIYVKNTPDDFSSSDLKGLMDIKQKKTLREYLEGYDHSLYEGDGIDEPTKSKKVEVDYDEIEKTLNDLIEKFTVVENIPHPGELSTEIKILKTFGDKIKYLKKYDESGKWK